MDSKNKKKKLNCNELTESYGYSKDSFDRFGDDLSELLLNYLSVFDKICFECVSKQFKRLVFNRQKKLIITKYMKKNEMKESDQKRIEFEGKYKDWDVIKVGNKVWKSSKQLVIRRLFQKFRSITDLKISELSVESIVFKELYENSNNLTQIDLKFNKLMAKDSERFAQMFGSKLKSITFSDNIKDNNFQTILYSSPKLEKIVFNSNYNKYNLKPLLNNDFSKLQTIVFKSSEESKNEELVPIIDKYKNQIRKLNVNKTFDDLLEKISLLSKIEELELGFSSSLIGLEPNLDSIGQKCPKLKVLTIDFHKIVLKDKILKHFNCFYGLERLEINSINSSKQFGNCKPLKSCPKLKYFGINIKYNVYTKDNFDDVFDDIHLFIPNLKQFSFEDHSEKCEITDKTLNNLSKIENLSKVYLKMDSYINTHYFEQITDCSVQLLINCHSINHIIVSYCLEQMKTIDTLIEKANNNPKIGYKFEFLVKSMAKTMTRIGLKSIPNNLKLLPVLNRHYNSPYQWVYVGP